MNRTEDSTTETTDVVTPSHIADYPLSIEFLQLLRLNKAVGYFVNIYLHSILAILGICFNIIAAMALWGRARKKSTYNYLLGLSAVDTLYLLSVPSYGFLKDALQIDVQKLVGCNLQWFTVNYLRQVSSWFLTLCCLERALIVSFPNRASYWFSRRSARVAMLVIVTSLLVPNWLFFNGIYTNMNNPLSLAYDTCSGRNNVINHYFKNVYPWVNLALYSIIPLLFLLTCNAIIIRKFVKSKNQVAPSSIKSIMSKSSRRVTIISVLLSVVFVVTTLPFTVGFGVFRSDVNAPLMETLTLETILTILSPLSLMNHCANLWIYLGLSRSFRDDVQALLRCGNVRAVLRMSAPTGTGTGMVAPPNSIAKQGASTSGTHDPRKAPDK